MVFNMQEWIINTMNQFGYAGIALLIAIENIFPPIPSEVILTFGGFMTTKSNLNIWLVLLSATTGSTAGAIVLYYIGRLVTPERLGRFIDRWGFLLQLKTQDILKAENWFNRRGSLTVFFCRFIPIVRSLISIPAGMAKLKMSKFLLYTVSGTAIWNVILINLGAFAGEKWSIIADYINTYSYVVFVLLAFAGVGIIIWLMCRKKIKKS
ncbi:DedA family protein [Lacrimispora sp.]|jgi:membrane protein DedA with SNARE-associated domain|uniref:DedA family protein n=2 Tax=Lacrimispora sp. TaxID=2719234 RepID=UPI00268298A2|nr:DedA family protein [Lacrimispora sp.]